MAYERLTLDAGHGGKDPGAVGKIVEKIYTLLYILELGRVLSLLGFKIKYTRDSDKFVDLSPRALMANAFKAAYFISVHFNAGGGHGIETYAYKPGGQGQTLASLVQKYLIQYTKVPNRGVKFANFAVLRITNMPAVLTELGFVDTDDADKIKQEEYKRNCMRAISRAICEQTKTPWRDVYAAPPWTPPAAPKPVVVAKPAPAPVVVTPVHAVVVNPALTPPAGPPNRVYVNGVLQAPNLTDAQKQSLGSIVWDLVALILKLLTGGK